MNAKEAKKLNQLYIENAVKSVYNNEDIDTWIKKAAESGHVGISIDINKFEWRVKDEYFKTIKAEYEARGFRVIRSQWSDPRDGDSGDNINIFWAS